VTGPETGLNDGGLNDGGLNENDLNDENGPRLVIATRAFSVSLDGRGRAQGAPAPPAP